MCILSAQISGLLCEESVKSQTSSKSVNYVIYCKYHYNRIGDSADTSMLNVRRFPSFKYWSTPVSTPASSKRKSLASSLHESMNGSETKKKKSRSTLNATISSNSSSSSSSISCAGQQQHKTSNSDLGSVQNSRTIETKSSEKKVFTNCQF